MAQRFNNKNAIITGAAGGIGFQTARMFGLEGASVCIMDINEEAADSAVDNLNNEGISAFPIQLDVTDEAAVEVAFNRAMEEFSGKVDILVNNAGIADFGSVETTDIQIWRRIMDVNVTATFICSRAVLPVMRKNGGGTIVNFGSVAGHAGINNMAAYCTAKAAVIGLTKQMAAQYSAEGIRVNCVSPGTVATTAMGHQLLGSDTSEEAMRRRLARYPIGRFGKPEEIARAVLFLASDEGSFCCGSDFVVDGGMTAI
jgi:NAD(P)-dependent dehydrogenase (short-subunit alcohol dehydrogenase family)